MIDPFCKAAVERMLLPTIRRRGLLVLVPPPEPPTEAFAGESLTPTYYVDPVNGSDLADGTTEGTAWRSLGRFTGSDVVNNTIQTIRFKPGTYGAVGDEIKIGAFTGSGPDSTVINLVFEPGCIIDGTVVTATNGSASAMDLAGDQASYYVYGNDCIIRNFTQGTGNGLGGNGSSQQLRAHFYNFSVENCVDGLSLHGSMYGEFHDCRVRTSLKSACAHIDGTQTKHYRCRLENLTGAAASAAVVICEGVQHDFVDCVVETDTNDAIDLCSSSWTRCRIGSPAARFNFTGAYGGENAAVIEHSYVHLNTDATRPVTLRNSYGRFTSRVRNGGPGQLIENCALVRANNALTYSNYSPPSATQVIIRDTRVDELFANHNSDARAQLVKDAGSLFSNIVLDIGQVIDNNLLNVDIDNTMLVNITNAANPFNTASADPADWEGLVNGAGVDVVDRITEPMVWGPPA